MAFPDMSVLRCRADVVAPPAGYRSQEWCAPFQRCELRRCHSHCTSHWGYGRLLGYANTINKVLDTWDTAEVVGQYMWTTHQSFPVNCAVWLVLATSQLGLTESQFPVGAKTKYSVVSIAYRL